MWTMNYIGKLYGKLYGKGEIWKEHSLLLLTLGWNCRWVPEVMVWVKTRSVPIAQASRSSLSSTWNPRIGWISDDIWWYIWDIGYLRIYHDIWIYIYIYQMDIYWIIGYPTHLCLYNIYIYISYVIYGYFRNWTSSLVFFGYLHRATLITLIGPHRGWANFGNHIAGGRHSQNAWVTGSTWRR